MATSVTSMNNFPCFKITATKAVTKQEGPKNFPAELHKISAHSTYSDNCYFHFFYQ